MSSESVVISLKDVSKAYHVYANPADRLKQSLFRGRRTFYSEVLALHGITLEIRRGETIGIIGRNGSGKSTLLQCICGTRTPTTGRIEVQGRVAALLELGAGFNPEFTGRENIYLNASLLGMTRVEIDAHFEDMVAFADIGPFLDRPVKTYSSGMYLRLAFAVVAHVQADILIIDEALAVGDVFFVQKCMRFLQEFKKRGTILFVSHSTSTVLTLCDRAVWLDRGRIRAEGGAKGVCEAYLAATYAGRGQDHLKIPNRSQKKDQTSDEPRQAVQGSFGTGQVSVVLVALHDASGQPRAWVNGGEMLTVIIRAVAHQTLHGPILGFICKNRLGQLLFGQNSYQAYADTALTIEAGQEMEARFTFRMPELAAGDYSLCVAVAEGTQENHVQHAWIHDALIFKSHATVAVGLMGVAMQNIELRTVE